MFVDTNVLVYSWDATVPAKRERALLWMTRLWDSQAGRTSVQVLNEFYVTVTRKLQPAIPTEQAQKYVRTLFAWHPAEIDANLAEQAWAIQARHPLSFWDALIVAAAQATECRYLLSEDLQDAQDLDGVLVVNPFTTEPDSLGDLQRQ